MRQDQVLRSKFARLLVWPDITETLSLTSQLLQLPYPSDLTRKGQPTRVEWSQAQEKAYQTIKFHLTNEPILRLRFSDPVRTYYLQTDASNTGIGAVLIRGTQREYGLTLLTLRSKFEFSFVAPIHFLQKQWGEVDKISSKFVLCDHVCNSHDQEFDADHS